MCELTQNRAQRCDHLWPDTPQVPFVVRRQEREDASTLGGDSQQHLSPILAAALAHHEASAFELVDQRDGGVVLHAQPLGDRANRGPRSLRQALQGQEKLVLLRFDAGSSRRLLTEREKAA